MLFFVVFVKKNLSSSQIRENSEFFSDFITSWFRMYAIIVKGRPEDDFQ